MQIVLYTKDGMELKSKNSVDKTIFNNPDVVKAEFKHLGAKLSFLLTQGRRLIFYTETNSPTTYFVGFQQTVKGRNYKYIMKIKNNGEMEMI